jgi:hypothetical protein
MTDTERPRGLECALPGLSPISTTQERIAALLEIGLPAVELRTAIGGVSEATIRNWSEHATVPRNGAIRALDDLRTCVVALHEAGLEGERAVGWLTSRNLGKWLRGERPIDMLAVDPLLVLAAVQNLLSVPDDANERDDNVVHLEIDPDRDRVPARTKKSRANARRRRKPSRV